MESWYLQTASSDGSSLFFSEIYRTVGGSFSAGFDLCLNAWPYTEEGSAKNAFPQTSRSLSPTGDRCGDFGVSCMDSLVVAIEQSSETNGKSRVCGRRYEKNGGCGV